MEFLDLYEIVAKYYPIGISDDDPQYFDFTGYKQLENLCRKKVERDQDERWKSLLAAIKSRNPKILASKVISQEYYPCFSASFQLLTEKTQTITYSRELQIHISILGPFFTIFGLDTVTLNQIQRTMEPLIFISPISIYEEFFNSARKLIGDYYLNYRFVPFSVLEQRVPGLRVSGAVNYFQQDASFYQALFTRQNVTNFQSEGDSFYD